MTETSLDLKDIEKHLKTGASPHIRNSRTSKQVMTEVLIALIPPLIAALIFFGWWVLVQMAVAIGVAVLTEFLYQKATYKRVTISDRSAVVTGALIGLSFPVVTPLWLIVFASVFAILIVKQWNGGLGKNYLNPAVTARVVSKLLFTPFFANWILPNGLFAGPYGGADAVSTATPLEYISDGATRVAQEVPELWELFLGLNLGGNIGETSKLAILIGMLYLIFRRVINPKIPILFIGSAMLVAALWADFNFDFIMTHALSGTLFFGATYMATDYSSGALTPTGKTIFAICGGVLTAAIRIAFNYPGGFGIAIIIMNFCAPFIDRYTQPRIYGHTSRPATSLDRQATK